MHILPLAFMTAFFVFGILGTVGKLLFDDWRVRQVMRLPVVLAPVKPQIPRLK